MTEYVPPLVHPGPVLQERVRALPCRLRRTEVVLRPGRSVNDSVAQAVQALGGSSAYVRLDGIPISPLRYVIPAEPPGGDHAVWWSETFAPAGAATTLAAGIFLGRRDGRPFTHCHGMWRLSDASVRMGHLLTEESNVAAEVHVPAWIISGAMLDVKHDPETKFRLFSPESKTEHDASTSRGLLATIRPHVDLAAAVSSLYQRHDFKSAILHGIGSLVGCKLRGSTELLPSVTEALILDGHVTGDGDILNLAAVDMQGRFATGAPEPEVPVAVTFELLIEEVAAAGA